MGRGGVVFFSGVATGKFAPTPVSCLPLNAPVQEMLIKVSGSNTIQRFANRRRGEGLVGEKDIRGWRIQDGSGDERDSKG